MKTFFCLVLLGVFATCLAQHKRNEKERRESPYSAYQPGRLPTYLSYLSQSKSEDVPLPVLKNYRPQGTSYRPQSTSTTQAQSQGVDVNGYLQYLGDTVNYIKQVLAGILYRLRALEVCNEHDLPKPRNGKRTCNRPSSSSSSYYPGGNSYYPGGGGNYGNNYNYGATDELECEVECDSGYGFPRTVTGASPNMNFTCENGKWEPNTIVENCQPLCSMMDLMTAAPTGGTIAYCTPAGTIPFKCVAACNDGYGFPGLVARVGSGMVQPGTLGTITATCTNGVQWDRAWFPDCERRCTLPTTVPAGAIVDCDPEQNPVVANARFASTCTVQCPEGETFGGDSAGTDTGISRIDYVCNDGVLETAVSPVPTLACGDV